MFTNFVRSIVIDEYNSEVSRWNSYIKTKNLKIKDEDDPILGKFLHQRNLIKLSSRLKRDKLLKGKMGEFNSKKIVVSVYRPFVKRFLCFDYIPVDLSGQQHEIFPNPNSDNKAIWF